MQLLKHIRLFGFDLDKVPERHSFSYGVDSNDVPQRHDPFLMASIPEIFHDFIDDIHDVQGDGNCGFRAVVVCLGLNEHQWLYIQMQLIEELQSHSNEYHYAFSAGFDEVYESLHWFDKNAPTGHWMTMPLTGYLIANRFDVIVHCFSHQNSMTCFPLWRGLEEFQPHRIVALAHVNGNHYMSFSLKRDYSMHPTTMYLNANRSQPAYAWKTMYWLRFESFNQHVPPSSPMWTPIDD